MHLIMVFKASEVVSSPSTTSPVSFMGPKNILLNTGLMPANKNRWAPIIFLCSLLDLPSSLFTRKKRSGWRSELDERKLCQFASTMDILEIERNLIKKSHLLIMVLIQRIICSVWIYNTFTQDEIQFI